MGWGALEIEQLKTLAAQGLSASQIAAEIGGVSRSSVLSKLRRSNIPLLGAVGGRKIARDVPSVKVTAIAPPPSEPQPSAADVPPCEPIGTLELSAGRCKFPVNDGHPRWLHCGDKADGVYCERHAALTRGRVAA